MRRISFTIITFLLLTGCSQSLKTSFEETAGTPASVESSSTAGRSASISQSSDFVAEKSDELVVDKRDANAIQSLTSQALVSPDSSDFKLLTTAYIQFETSKVAKTIPEVENILILHKGVIIESSISSSNLYDNLVGESIDSIFYERSQNVYGRITVYLLKYEVYDALDEISPLATHIKTRNISSNDISIKLLETKLDKQRAEIKQQRLKNTVANKPSKLNDVLEAEETIDESLRQQNKNTVEAFQLNRDLKYVKLSIDVYQQPVISTYAVSQNKDFSMSILDQLIVALSFGWNMISQIFLLFIYIWPISIFLIVSFVLYFRYRKKKKA